MMATPRRSPWPSCVMVLLLSIIVVSILLVGYPGTAIAPSPSGSEAAAQPKATPTSDVCVNPDHMSDPCAFVQKACDMDTILFNPIVLYYCHWRTVRLKWSHAMALF